jgi:ribosomal protein S12 methylthiotransferase accessory factor
MRRAVDPLTGIVSGVRVTRPGDSDSTVDCTVAWGQGGTDTRWFSPVRASTVGGATKHDALDAEVCALGELLERYAAGIYDPELFLRAALTQLGSSAVDPRELPLGSSREYKTAAPGLARFHPDLVLDWVAGTVLRGGRQRYVPACAVYVPYQAPRKSERLLVPVSTGLAAGSTLAQAVRGGLLEVIERDAAAICWYNRLTVPTLDWQSLPASPARTVLDRMRQRGVQLLAKNITTDIAVPTVMLLGRGGTPEQPMALCGFRADVDLHASLFGAAQELEHLLAMYARFAELGGVLEMTPEPNDIWDFATYYCHQSRVGLLDFLHDGPLHPIPAPGCDPMPDTDAVEHIVDRLSASGYHPVAVDITPVDVAECGVTVVRSVVPGLQPVTFSEKFRRLGGPRVYQAPVRMGLRDTSLAEHELNRYPIPLG